MERRKSGSSPSSTAKDKWGQSQEAPRENSQLESGQTLGKAVESPFSAEQDLEELSLV